MSGRGFARAVRQTCADAAELVWRSDCIGCARTEETMVAPGVGLCRDCALQLRAVPQRTDGPGNPIVTAAGPYGGVHRAVVLAAKDHHRPDAVAVLGNLFAGVIRHLIALGELPDPRTTSLILLPAPTRRSAARARGGCVVARGAAAAAQQLGGHAGSAMVATLKERTPDLVGLSRIERQAAVSRAVTFDSASVAGVRQELRREHAVACIVDDVYTTGATLRGFSLALAARGIIPRVGVVAARA